ncbi:PKD domain-containing protein, partial [Streptomyces sp. NPDC085614]|uniref:PKD domain-containing protein n=1 Tax=Streptomyces sp. NPDC085614 TaxID=3365733 RepID=UPI0037D3A148
VSHTWSAAGTYAVELTVTDVNGVQATDTVTVTITANVPPPTAAAGVDVQAVTGAAVALNGSASTGSGLSYSWNFKDGSAAGTGAQVSHTWSAAGTYAVELTVTDVNGVQATDTVTVTVTAPGSGCTYCTEVQADAPVAWWRLDEASGTTAADATGHGNTGTHGGNVLPLVGVGTGALNGVTGKGVDYEVAGASRTAISPAVPIASRANVTVESWVKTTRSERQRLVSDHANTSSSSSGISYLGVYQGKAEFGVTLPTPSDGAAVNKTYLGTTLINDGQWHHLAAVRTPTSLTLYVDGMVENTWNETQVHQAFGYTSLGQRFTVSAVAGVKFSLDEPAIYSTALSAARIAAHYAHGKDNNYTAPTASAGPDATATAGQSVSLNAVASGGTAPYTYNWTYGDGQTGTGASPQHTYSAAGIYTVTLTVTDGYHVTTTDTLTVTVG